MRIEGRWPSAPPILQARYVLPAVIKTFCEKYPEVEFHLHQGTSEQIAEMGKLGRIDFAIATGSQQLFPDYVLLRATNGTVASSYPRVTHWRKFVHQRSRSWPNTHWSLTYSAFPDPHH